MKNFQTARNGFNKEEVALFVEDMEEQLSQKQAQIEKLEKELEFYKSKENDIKEKGENISIALTAAVEKAKQIEKSSKNVYKLKIEELEILYARWEKVLNELIEKYPNLDELDNVKKVMAEFKSSLKSNLKEDFKFVAKTNTVLDGDPMRVLLGKMNSSFDKQVSSNKEIKSKTRPRRQLSCDVLQKQTDLAKLEEKSTMIKPIFEARIEKGEKYESLLDKFLTQESSYDSEYVNKVTANKENQTAEKEGFNLKEAVNPKESLETIMQSFDFFSQG